MNHETGTSMAVLEVFTGRTRPVDIAGRREPTAFAARRRDGRVRVTREGLEGNHLATARRLGRDNHAVYLFSRDHYAHFGAHLGRRLAAGAFAENVLYNGVDESGIRIGDRLRLGTAQIEVTTPRVPCYKLAHFLGSDAGFPSYFSASGRTGFYGRVVEEGEVWAGAELTRIATSTENAVLRELNHVLTDMAPDPAVVERVLQSPALLPAAAEVIQERLEKLRPGGFARPQPAQIRWRERLSADTSLLEVAPLHPCAVYPQPGQFITLGIADDAGDLTYRCYSLIDGPTPAEPHRSYRIAVRVDQRSRRGFSVSRALNEPADVPSDCMLFPPAGDFVLPSGAGLSTVRFVAGGIGITPIFWQIKSLLAGGSGTSIRLDYVCRHLEDAVFDASLAELATAPPSFEYRLYLTRDGTTDPRPGRQVCFGRPELASLVAETGPQDDIYVCGPLAMIEAVRDAHSRLRRENGRLHFELFDESLSLQSTDSPAESARLTIASHGVDGDWRPVDGYLLAWIESRTNLRPPAACRSGLCRTCSARLDRGEVVYPASVRPPGPSTVLLCCAQPVTQELVISLPADMTQAAPPE